MGCCGESGAVPVVETVTTFPLVTATTPDPAATSTPATTGSALLKTVWFVFAPTNPLKLVSK